MTPAAVRLCGVTALLLAAWAVASRTDVPGLAERAHDRLVSYFAADAAARSPVSDDAPVAMRQFRAPRRPTTTAAPVHIEIPSIGVSSALDRLDLAADGAIEPPPEWQVAGWFRRGPKPGQRGPAVVLGHVDSTTGPAIFARLHELGAGDEIIVRRKDGSTARFAVQRSARYPKARFPTGEVYLPTPEPTLRLVTCGGSFDRSAGSYRENLVVFADLIE